MGCQIFASTSFFLKQVGTVDERLILLNEMNCRRSGFKPPDALSTKAGVSLHPKIVFYVFGGTGRESYITSYYLKTPPLIQTHLFRNNFILVSNGPEAA